MNHGTNGATGPSHYVTSNREITMNDSIHITHCPYCHRSYSSTLGPVAPALTTEFVSPASLENTDSLSSSPLSQSGTSQIYSFYQTLSLLEQPPSSPDDSK